jgi:anti-anti-sigma factor
MSGRRGLEIEQRGEDGELQLLLIGELDIAVAPRLQETIARVCEQDRARALTIDLSRLAFIDSSGMAAIVYASRFCERHDCELSLVPAQQPVQRVFELTGLDALLPFHGGEDGRSGS